MDYSTIGCANPDFETIRSYLAQPGRRYEVKPPEIWWTGTKYNELYYDYYNNNSILKLEECNSDVKCPNCGKKSFVSKATVWFLEIQYGFWTKKGKHVELVAYTPFSFCQNYVSCRTMLFLCDDKSGSLKGFDADNDMLWNYIQEILCEKYTS